MASDQPTTGANDVIFVTGTEDGPLPGDALMGGGYE